MSGKNFSKALNLHLSLLGFYLSSLPYFVVQTDPKILRLVVIDFRGSPEGLVTLDADVRRTLHPLLDQRVGEVIPLLVSPLPLLRRLPPLVIVWISRITILHKSILPPHFLSHGTGHDSQMITHRATQCIISLQCGADPYAWDEKNVSANVLCLTQTNFFTTEIMKLYLLVIWLSQRNEDLFYHFYRWSSSAWTQLSSLAVVFSV